MESILDQDLEPNFRPKPPCKCPKLAILANSQLTKEIDKQMTPTSDNRQTTNDNILSTIRKMQSQAPKLPRPQQTYRKIDQKSDWSDSDNGKDNQARSKPIVIDITSDQEANIDPQPSTSNASASAPL